MVGGRRGAAWAGPPWIGALRMRAGQRSRPRAMLARPYACTPARACRCTSALPTRARALRRPCTAALTGKCSPCSEGGSLVCAVLCRAPVPCLAGPHDHAGPACVRARAWVCVAAWAPCASRAGCACTRRLRENPSLHMPVVDKGNGEASTRCRVQGVLWCSSSRSGWVVISCCHRALPWHAPQGDGARLGGQNSGGSTGVRGGVRTWSGWGAHVHVPLPAALSLTRRFCCCRAGRRF